ncbi:MAG: phosphodiesterase, partial [Candidatus Tectomicrobia bacterium]
MWKRIFRNKRQAKQPITLVSGLPRSGTSMMMHMLVAGGMDVVVDNTRQADEDNPQGYYEFEPVKQLKEDASWLDHAPGKAVKVISGLLYDLPPDKQYKIIFMQRRMQEVLDSQRTMLQRRQSSSA